MFAFINGQLVPEAEATVSVLDRSFLYGDGLFETLRVYNGRPFRWRQHLQRIERGAEFLKISLPFSAAALQRQAEALIQKNQLPECVLRMTLSRGVGIRGYSTKDADRPTLVMTVHPLTAPAKGQISQWRLITSTLRVPAGDPVANYKTCNKLHQILARAEAEAQSADEALLLNTEGEIAEGASCNLFWIRDARVCTTPLASGILAGVTRELVIELCQSLSFAIEEVTIKPAELTQADGVFVTFSSLGIIEIVALDGVELRRSPLLPQIWRAYQDCVEQETARFG
ncbi:MAG: aminodeoxychorismate lyase [Verrucomicrobia bacterium]|nr:aminodeoxychorismate lyase [Verrucomicrobiota bacterium]